MFANWSHWKTLKTILFTLVALVPTVVPAQYQSTATAIVGVVGALVVLLSGTPLGPTMASNLGGMAKDAARVAALVLVLVGLGTQTACGSLQPLGPNTITTLALEAKDAICVLAKLGEPATQILSECQIPQDQLQAVLALVGEAQKSGVSVTVATPGGKR